MLWACFWKEEKEGQQAPTPGLTVAEETSHPVEEMESGSFRKIPLEENSRPTLMTPSGMNHPIIWCSGVKGLLLKQCVCGGGPGS